MGLEQEGFRFRLDDDDEDAATWLADQDVNIMRRRNLNTRIRILVDAGTTTTTTTSTTTTTTTTSTTTTTTTTTTTSTTTTTTSTTTTTTSGGGGGDILSETFNSAGYDNSWTETLGGTNAINEDSTDAPPIGGTGFATQCCFFDYNQNSNAMYTQWVSASTHTIAYFSGYLYVKTAMPAGESSRIMSFMDSSDNELISLRLSNDTGVIRLNLSIANGGAYSDFATINVSTSYLIQVKCDTATPAWELKVGGSVIESGAHDPGAAIKKFNLGTVSIYSDSHEYYWDTVDLDSSGYINGT